MSKSKKTTLKQEIQVIVEQHKEDTSTEELQKAIYLLVQKSLYPKQFCPECEERLFNTSSGWSCPNCGYTTVAPAQNVAVTATTCGAVPQSTPPAKVRATLPEGVNKLIGESKRTVNASSRGEAIRKAAESIGTVPMTEASKNAVRAAVGRTDINFV